MSEALEGNWWRDKETLARVVREAGGFRAAAQQTGVNHSTLSQWWKKLGLPEGEFDHAGPTNRVREGAAEPDSPQWLIDTLRKAGDNATVEQLADLADVSPKRVREALERLGKSGYRVLEAQNRVTLDRVTSPTDYTFQAAPELFDGDAFRFGVVSDVHTSSQAERLDDLHTAYEILRREGISAVYNPGDIADGIGIYRGQVNEITNHTYEAQVEHARRVYPQVDGITTYLISGNHDCEGQIGAVGADVALAVSLQRDDIIHLGRYSAWIDLPNGARIHMLHPQGGGAYAKSYRLQKIIESYMGGLKPNILLCGHYHQTTYLFDRGVHALHAGTLQGPTTFSTRKAMGQAGLGFWIIEGVMADDGSIVRFRPEFFPFYAGRSVG